MYKLNPAHAKVVLRSGQHFLGQAERLWGDVPYNSRLEGHTFDPTCLPEGVRQNTINPGKPYLIGAQQCLDALNCPTYHDQIPSEVYGFRAALESFQRKNAPIPVYAEAPKPTSTQPKPTTQPSTNKATITGSKSTDKLRLP